MFAPKIAERRTKLAVAASANPDRQRSMPVGHRSGDGIVEQARYLQRTIGNQAALRLLAREFGHPIEQRRRDRPSAEVRRHGPAQPNAIRRDVGSAGLDDPAHPGGLGAQKFPASDRGDWQSFFQQALQGVSGKPNRTAQQKAELAAAIADECMSRLARHGCEIGCAQGVANDPASSTNLSIALALTGPWGDSFKSALQATTGGDYTSAAVPVNQAADIADQAVLASGVLEPGLWNIYMKCIADQTCVSSED